MPIFFSINHGKISGSLKVIKFFELRLGLTIRLARLVVVGGCELLFFGAKYTGSKVQAHTNCALDKEKIAKRMLSLD